MSLRATLRRSWPVLVSYGAFSVWGVGCLVASVVLTAGGGLDLSAGSAARAGGILLAVAIGHVAGNLLGLAGLRFFAVTALFTALFAGGALSGLVVGAFAALALIAAFSALGGYLGVASRLGVVAAWYPLSFCIGGAIVWMNRHGLGVWRTGAKHAIWDGFTLVCLAGGVFLMLVFLATRNALGLAVWQDVARPRRSGGEPGASVARPGRGSVVVLFAFTLVVLGVTALLSPYLFRTRASSGSAEPSRTDTRGPCAGDGTSGGGGGALDCADARGASRAASGALALAMRLFAWLLVVALLLLLLLLVAFPPLRRALLLRHLERPLWPVAPTARVMNLWRRALAELAVVGVAPSAGEAPRDFARRAASELQTAFGMEAPGLNVAAELVERIDYAGRGLGAGDELAMRRAVGAFVAALAPRAPLKRRIAAAWGRAPEVEP